MKIFSTILIIFLCLNPVFANEEEIIESSNQSAAEAQAGKSNFDSSTKADSISGVDQLAFLDFYIASVMARLSFQDLNVCKGPGISKYISFASGAAWTGMTIGGFIDRLVKMGKIDKKAEEITFQQEENTSNSQNKKKYSENLVDIMALVESSIDQKEKHLRFKKITHQIPIYGYSAAAAASIIEAIFIQKEDRCKTPEEEKDGLRKIWKSIVDKKNKVTDKLGDGGSILSSMVAAPLLQKISGDQNIAMMLSLDSIIWEKASLAHKFMMKKPVLRAVYHGGFAVYMGIASKKYKDKQIEAEVEKEKVQQRIELLNGQIAKGFQIQESDPTLCLTGNNILSCEQCNGPGGSCFGKNILGALSSSTTGQDLSFAKNFVSSINTSNESARKSLAASLSNQGAADNLRKKIRKDYKKLTGKDYDKEVKAFTQNLRNQVGSSVQAAIKSGKLPKNTLAVLSQASSGLASRKNVQPKFAKVIQRAAGSNTSRASQSSFSEDNDIDFSKFFNKTGSRNTASSGPRVLKYNDTQYEYNEGSIRKKQDSLFKILTMRYKVSGLRRLKD